MPPTCLMSSPYLNKPSPLQQGYDNNNYKITSPHICMQYQGAHFLFSFYLDNILHIKFNKNPFYNINLEKLNTLTSVYFLSKPSLKIGTANAICWNSLGLFRDYDGLNHIFLVIKLFCFSRQKAEIFSICLKKNFVKPHKFSTQSDNIQIKLK